MLKVRLSLDVFNLNPTTSQVLIGDFMISDCNLTRPLNGIGSFDFTLPASSLINDKLPLVADDPRYIQGGTTFTRKMAANLYLNGQEIIAGIVNNITIDLIADEMVYKFSCDSEMIQLAKLRAKTNAVYQNRQVLHILMDLLWGYYWRLGDLTTMPDPLVTTTIDLRGEKHLLPQIKKLIESVPNLFFRYGGTDTSQNPSLHFIDVGSFGEDDPTFIKQDHVSDLSQTIKFSNTLHIVEAYGGEITVAGDKRRINLDDALDYDPDLDTANSPFVVNSGTKYMRNSLLTQFVGEETVEYFDEIVPETKTDPSAAEIEEAGYALYLKTYALMSQNADAEDQWAGTLKRLPEDFELGNNLYLQSNARQIFYNYVTQKAYALDLGQVSQWYRVNGYSLQIKGEDLSYKLDLATNIRLPSKVDPVVDLYETINQVPQVDDAALSTPINEFTVLHETVPTDLSADGFVTVDGVGYPARMVTIPVGAFPLGKTSATIALMESPIFSTTDGAVLELMSENFVTAGGSFTVAVSVNGNWTEDDTAEIYILVEFN